MRRHAPQKLLHLLYIALLLASCSEERLKTYDGQNFMHFSYMADKSAQRVTFNFATQAPLADEADVPVSLSLWGFPFGADAAYRVSADDGRSLQGAFRAGRATDTLYLHVSRDTELLATHYTLHLTLEQADGCVVGPSDYASATVTIVDSLDEPRWWSQSMAARLGAYSPLKHRLLIIFMGGEVLTSIDRYTGIEFQQLITDFKQWWRRQWDEGRYRYYATDNQTPLYETIED